MVNIRWYHGTSFSHLLSYKLWRDVSLNAKFTAVHVLTNGDILHFFRNDTALGKSHLRLAFLAFCNPRLAQFRKTFLEVDVHVWVAVRTTCVVDIDGIILLKMLLAILYGHRRSKRHSAHSHLQFGVYHTVHIDFLRTGISDFNVVVHIYCIICFIIATGFSALNTVPLTAIPLTPVASMSSMSSAVMPPMATTGRSMPAASIFSIMSL